MLDPIFTKHGLERLRQVLPPSIGAHLLDLILRLCLSPGFELSERFLLIGLAFQSIDSCKTRVVVDEDAEVVVATDRGTKRSRNVHMDESKNDCGTFLRRRKGATGHLALRTPITRLVCRRTNAIYASSSIWQTTKCFFAWMSPSTVSYVIVEGGMGRSIKNASVPLSYDERKNIEIKMRNIRCLNDTMSADLNRRTGSNSALGP